MPGRPRLLLAALALAIAAALASCGGSSTTTVERTVTVMKTNKAPQTRPTLLPDVLGKNHVEPKTYSFSADGDPAAGTVRAEGSGEAQHSLRRLSVGGCRIDGGLS